MVKLGHRLLMAHCLLAEVAGGKYNGWKAGGCRYENNLLESGVALLDNLAVFNVARLMLKTS
jgi:hypothetical protein